MKDKEDKEKTRCNFTMTLTELEKLVRVVKVSKSKREAQVESNRLWRILGKRYGFDWRTVGKPTLLGLGPQTFSAIPTPKKKQNNGG